ncbi:MAG: polyphosphate kinase [Sphaerochaeta sp.]|jgi:polyphosphate kinase|uniref:Polyphosphate kinase n=1 Tax=Sphaerochaeta halotolerans TaxID=2293840 RepID=A0A372MEW9_9SPIR|nr:polyphosphate kinase 1 [Sphaerochaeta halotolerans]MBG0767625.1 polyphosphate kinase 1 [Spirochaetaceae bacterium]MDK2859583.1 polyphosphate kinase [Sphaerochaeta sp.]MDN5333526.1 polyphosphate kinase [Sphaerochaeta sp.]RFU93938.1 polyphosphate kinase 1 [Sphaerochaeta halotolerans]
MGSKKVYVNRELRWLSFNERVLMSAENPNIPLMERLKFIGIFSSNLDEFYAVRVGSIHRALLDPEHYKLKESGNPKTLIRQILKEVKRLNDRMDRVVEQLFRTLRTHHIAIVDEATLSDEQKQFLEGFFRHILRNRLFPILLDPKLPFPYLKHVTLYLAVHMYHSHDPKDFRYALIEVPSDLIQRYVELPSRGGWHHFIALEDIIRFKLADIFKAFSYDCYDAYTIKITRDGEYDLTDEITRSLYEKLSTSIKQRSQGDPVRFVYDRELPKPMLEYIMEHAQLKQCRIIIPGGRYHNARDLLHFPKVGNDQLYFEEQPPLPHHTLKENRSLLDQIDERDHLVTLPYQSYDCIIDLLREAALDRTVQGIKMTLYRVPENSSVINALRNAARNGKEIVLYLELQARFDEEINMHWTEILTREPHITLISGVEGMKVHSKLGLITRYSGKKQKKIAIIGTGNFNEVTASQYSDHLLLTSNTKLTQEIDLLFTLLDRGFADIKFKHLIVSPFHTRKRFISLIKKEMEEAREGRPAAITLKLNNLVDEGMIKHLSKAEHSGVSITLMIRGICSMALYPEQKNVRGKALIDRYLEHTRVVKFHNKGNPLYFIGSADWMERNLDTRIEVMVPIFDDRIKEELELFLQAHWNDTASSFSLHEENFNQRLQLGEPNEKRAQRDLYLWYQSQLEENL